MQLRFRDWPAVRIKSHVEAMTCICEDMTCICEDTTCICKTSERKALVLPRQGDNIPRYHPSDLASCLLMLLLWIGSRLGNDLITYSAHAGASDGPVVRPPALHPASDGQCGKGIPPIMTVRIICVHKQLGNEELHIREHGRHIIEHIIQVKVALN